MFTFSQEFLTLLFFLAFMGALIAVWPADFDLSGIGALAPFLLIPGLAALSVFLAERVTRWRERRQRERRLARALAALSMSLEEVLAAAPYDYAHWQGEDGYRIVDVRVKDGFVGHASSEFEAILWIVERYLADKREAEAS